MIGLMVFWLSWLWSYKCIPIHSEVNACSQPIRFWRSKMARSQTKPKLFNMLNLQRANSREKIPSLLGYPFFRRFICNFTERETIDLNGENCLLLMPVNTILVLFQTINKEVKILGYNSRVLKETEFMYSTPQKELISILYHVKWPNSGGPVVPCQK